MEDKDNAELLKEIKSLEKKVDALSTPLEDALAYRVFLKSHEQIKKWFFLYIGVVTAAITVVGFFGYREIVGSAKTAAKEYLAKTSIEKLKQEISFQVAYVTANQEKKIDILTQAVDANTNKIKPEAATSSLTISTAYAFYGITNDRGGWDEVNFKSTSSNDRAFPKVGDVVTTSTPVTAREGMIQYDDARGWYNTKSKGIIKAGTKVKVIEVNRVPDNNNFIWIKFQKTE